MANNSNLTPSQIVGRLDQHIVGQDEAKKEVAISLRTRWRRMQLAKTMQKEVSPANMILVGSTGVGKTEIARRVADLTDAPFLKSEVTKFTEVGYVGGQVDQLIQDLVEIAAVKVKTIIQREHAQQIEEEVLEDIVEDLAPTATEGERYKIYNALQKGKLDSFIVEIFEYAPMPKTQGGQGDPATTSLNILDNIFGAMGRIQGGGEPGVQKTITIKDLKVLYTQYKTEDLLDPPTLNKKIIEITENNGIIFLDELDKLIDTEGARTHVSREGVQRDLLPLVEGTTVSTKYGMVKTDHILFIAAGAFAATTPNDLMPELQGRFPIRVELSSLTTDDFCKILSKTKGSIIKQQEQLLKSDGIDLNFTKDGILSIAEYATMLNKKQTNIGARRLTTIVTAVVKEHAFLAPDKISSKRVTISKKSVKKVLDKIVKDEDLSKFIL